MSSPAELAACTAPLLDPDTSPGEVYVLLDRLETLLARHTPFRKGDAMEAGETWLESGLAISPTQAAMCLRDVRRTHAFAAGLHAAILRARAEHPERPAHVLYAGCGPYALLALPSLAALDATNVRFTLLDLHEESLDSARVLLESLGLADRVTTFVCADAVTFRDVAADPPDVVLTETMTAGLQKEPQVAITRNLLAQAPDAILVPHSVRVDVSLVDVAKEHAVGVGAETVSELPTRDRIPLGTAFELSEDGVKEWEGLEGASLPGGCVRFPDTIDGRYEAMMFTVIDVAEGVRIADYDSSLTIPRPLPGDVASLAGSTLDFTYSLANPPGLIPTPRR